MDADRCRCRQHTTSASQVTDSGVPPANAGYTLDPNHPPVPNTTVADLRIVVRSRPIRHLTLIGVTATGADDQRRAARRRA